MTNYEKLCEVVGIKIPYYCTDECSKKKITNKEWCTECCYRIDTLPDFTAEKQIELIKMINSADFIDYIGICEKADRNYMMQAVCITEFASENPKLYTEVQRDFAEALAGLTLQLIEAGELEKDKIKRILE